MDEAMKVDVDGYRCGFVSLIGKPNVGKSTLMNRMLEQKVAITSPRPQTTRNRVCGVLSRTEHQLIFIDTPGIHEAKRALNKYMVEVAKEAVFDTDVVALLVDVSNQAECLPGRCDVLDDLVVTLTTVTRPVVLVLNKVDLVDKDSLLPIISAWSEVMRFAEIVPICAQTGVGVEGLENALVGHVPEGPQLYPDDMLTDMPERFLAAELVREAAFRLLNQELPYAIGIRIDQWSDRMSVGRVDIRASVIVERDSQKGIVIGKGGQMLKRIGTRARAEIGRMLDCDVNLRLFVKVESGWTRTVSAIRQMGYTK
jgi:GTPase